MRPGLYRTEYDNVCIVRSANAKRAWDMDQAEWIPIELVDQNSFIRKIEPGDLDSRMDE